MCLHFVLSLWILLCILKIYANKEWSLGRRGFGMELSKLLCCT
jgi:hypothetical protein